MIKYSLLNPLNFSSDYDKRLEEEDIYRHIEQVPFCQEFTQNDFLNFQIFWEGIRYRPRRRVYAVDVYLNVNGTETLYNKTTTENNDEEFGIFYKTPYENNGVYVFKRRIGVLPVSDGDTVGIRVVLWTYDNFVVVQYSIQSNKFRINNQTEHKFMAYACLDTPYMYETNFEYVDIFNIRLPASFTDILPNADAEIFNDYGNTPQLVSAIPYERYNLHIGGDNGIPIWLQKKLNYIFHCNFKYIAGNRYELTEDGIQYSRETTYSNAWADVRLGKINDSESEDLSGDFVFGFVFMTLNDIRINVSVETEGYWILSYNGTKVSGYDYSGVVCSLPINTTSAPITYKFTLKNLLSERVISEKNLTINPISVSRIFDNTFDLTFN